MSVPLSASNARPVDDDFVVAGQISIEQVPAIVEAGFKTVICNRPDGEETSQPSHDAIKVAVEAVGLTFLYRPVISGAMTMDDVQTMAADLPDLAFPVFAYCRSGARSTQLYQMARQMG